MITTKTPLLQVQTSAKDKEKSSAILQKLETKLSVVINMLIKQIIITEGVPFEIKMSHPIYSAEEAVNEVLWLATAIILKRG